MPALTLLVALLTFVAPLTVPSVGQLNQTERETLRGISALYVMVPGKETPAWQECNLRQSDLRLSIGRPLADAGIKVVDPYSAGPIIGVYLNVILLRTSSEGCAASVHVSVQTSGVTKLEYLPPGSAAVGANVLLWHDGALLIGSTLTFGDRVNELVRKYVDQFATKVKLANIK